MTTTTNEYTKILNLNDLSVISKTWDHLEEFLTGLMQGQVNVAALNHQSIEVLIEFIDHFSEEDATVRNLPLHEVLKNLDETLELVSEYFPYLSGEVMPLITSMSKKWGEVGQSLMPDQEPPKDANQKAIAAKKEKQAKIRKLSIKESEQGIAHGEIKRRAAIRTQCLNADLTNSVARKMIQQNVPTNKVPEAISEALMQRNNRKQR